MIKHQSGKIISGLRAQSLVAGKKKGSTRIWYI
jgi:hypothetical protein